MYLTLNKREFQQTIMVYHYYIQANIKLFSKGVHAPADGGKPGTADPKIDEQNDGKWDWKGEDKIWTGYMGFLKNRTMENFYAQQWSALTTKAKFLGLRFAEYVSNIELESNSKTKVVVTTNKTLIMNKKAFQHFMMLYTLNNLTDMDLLLERVGKDDEKDQWKDEDRPWHDNMLLFSNRGISNWIAQRQMMFEPIIKTLGLRMAIEITNSRIENGLRIRMVV